MALRGPSRIGGAGARIGGKHGSLRWDESELNFETIMDFDQATINECKQRLRVLAALMVDYAQTHAPWNDHPNRHPSARWPGSRTAREGLSSRVYGTKIIGLTLSHAPSTIYANLAGSRYNYGFALEAGDLAIIVPTMEAFADEFMNVCEGAMNNHQGPVADATIGGDGG